MTSPHTSSPPVPELLAPAGNRGALQAALLAGADAVYLAGRSFGARASAENFDAAGLAWARRVTRALGRRLYVTVNTLVFDSELAALERHLALLADLEVDAVIVQDLGVLDTLQRRGHRLPVHLSTQAAWDGAGGADELHRLGVTRVVLPRETPLPWIQRLCAEGPFEIEVFVHGAHCYSVSGRCWWSAALGPRSGNRGTCAQPCRRGYAAGDAPEPWFSPRDLRALSHLPALREAGVTSLKIEGRLKRADYVAAVTRSYRRALAGEIDLGEPLDRVFGREWTAGFLGGAPPVWRTVTSVGVAGEPVGVVHQPDDGQGRVVLTLERPVSRGDGLAWTQHGESRGARITWIDAEEAGTRRARLRGDPPHREGLSLRRTSRSQLADPLEGWDPAWEEIAVRLRFSGREGSPLIVEATADAKTVRCVAEGALEPARGEGLDAILPTRFARLAAPYRVDRLEVDALSPGLFLPPRLLKALRRDLEGALAAPTPTATRKPAPAIPPASTPDSPTPHTWIRLWRLEDLAPLSDLRPSGGWILPAASMGPSHALPPDSRVRYWLPPRFGPGAADELAELVAALPPDEVLCLSWEALALARRFPEHRFRLDWTFNVANHRAARQLHSAGLRSTAAPEADPPPPGIARVRRFNPLVSLSRFPPAPGDPHRVTNPHGDRFHRLPLSPACWGLFLERLPKVPLPAPDSTLQLDVVLLDPDRRAELRERLAATLAT